MRVGHGELANHILGKGTTVKTEKLSHKAWQRRYGKSTKVRSPAGFVNVLRNKITAAGDELMEFGTRQTCLFQFCHLDGTYTKKPLYGHAVERVSPPLQQGEASLSTCNILARFDAERRLGCGYGAGFDPKLQRSARDRIAVRR